MAESETSPSDEAERQEEVDMLYKKMSVERHERLKKDMRDLITRFRMRGQKYEDKANNFIFIEILKKIIRKYLKFLFIIKYALR